MSITVLSSNFWYSEWLSSLDSDREGAGEGGHLSISSLHEKSDGESNEGVLVAVASLNWIPESEL